MPDYATFACPNCGAPLHAEEGRISVVCRYCGNTVSVPSSMRPTERVAPVSSSVSPPAPTAVLPHIVIINEQATAPPQAPPASRRLPRARTARASGAFLRGFIILLLLAAAVTAVYAALRDSAPYFFTNLFAGGYARVDGEYGDDTTLKSLAGVAADSLDHIYVADSSAGRVHRFSTAGTYLNSWPVELSDIKAIAASDDGIVYVVAGNRIGKYEGASGNLLATLDVSTGFSLGLQSLAVLPGGDLLAFLQGDTDALVRLDPGGTEVARYPRPITEVNSDAVPVPWLVHIAADKESNLLLLYAFPTNPAVYIFTPEGRYVRTFGEEGDGQGQFRLPSAIAADTSGRIYVSDLKGIQVFTREGEYEGIIRLPFSGAVSGMTFDAENRLFVVSATQHKLYKLALNAP